LHHYPESVETFQQNVVPLYYKRSEKRKETMKTFKNIGLIVCGDSQEIFRLSAASKSNGYAFKKVLIEEDASENTFRINYPHAEIVKDKHAIIQDAALDLVIIAAPVNKYASLVAEVLKSGIPVRVISPV
jgi:predicted dehydrogenase